MKLFLATALLAAIVVPLGPVAAADLNRDVQTLRNSVKSLQSQLRAQRRTVDRITALERRVARLTNQLNALRNAGGGSGTGSGSAALESRVQKLENVVRISGANVILKASGKISLSSSSAQIDAGSVRVNSGVSTFSGTVTSKTVITDSVVSKSYTPGAGNIW